MVTVWVVYFGDYIVRGIYDNYPSAKLHADTWNRVSEADGFRVQEWSVASSFNLRGITGYPNAVQPPDQLER